MSKIIGNGKCITYMETEITCPICTFAFDISDKIDKADLPIFKMKCPGCKSAIGISLPIFGGNTECFEWNAPKTIKDNRLKSVTLNRINGQAIPI